MAILIVPREKNNGKSSRAGSYLLTFGFRIPLSSCEGILYLKGPKISPLEREASVLFNRVVSKKRADQDRQWREQLPPRLFSFSAPSLSFLRIPFQERFPAPNDKFLAIPLVG